MTDAITPPVRDEIDPEIVIDDDQNDTTIRRLGQ